MRTLGVTGIAVPVLDVVREVRGGDEQERGGDEDREGDAANRKPPPCESRLLGSNLWSEPSHRRRRIPVGSRGGEKT